MAQTKKKIILKTGSRVGSVIGRKNLRKIILEVYGPKTEKRVKYARTGKLRSNLDKPGK